MFPHSFQYPLNQLLTLPPINNMYHLFSLPSSSSFFHFLFFLLFPFHQLSLSLTFFMILQSSLILASPLIFYAPLLIFSISPSFTLRLLRFKYPTHASSSAIITILLTRLRLGLRPPDQASSETPAQHTCLRWSEVRLILFSQDNYAKWLRRRTVEKLLDKGIG